MRSIKHTIYASCKMYFLYWQIPITRVVSFIRNYTRRCKSKSLTHFCSIHRFQRSNWGVGTIVPIGNSQCYQGTTLWSCQSSQAWHEQQRISVRLCIRIDAECISPFEKVSVFITFVVWFFFSSLLTYNLITDVVRKSKYSWARFSNTM